MLFDDRELSFLKGLVLLDENPDWELLARKFEMLQEARGFRIVPLRAYEEEGSIWLPLAVRATGIQHDRRHLSDRRRRADEDFDSTAWIRTFAGELEGWLGYPVEMVPIDLNTPSSDVLDAFDEISEIFRRGSIFEPPKPMPSAQDLMPATAASGDDPVSELDALIGLSDVKRQVHKITSLAAKTSKANLPCMHMVFRGNPGTGKTTVARLIGRIFGELGVIDDKDVFVEVGREDLIGKYVGSTAPKTHGVIKKAKGGILFIDEAYSLGLYGDKGYDYGDEALAVLVKEMEDSRDDFICIMAGYTEPMDKMLDLNPGLRDRIGFYIDFPDYSENELLAVFEKFAHDDGFELSEDAEGELAETLHDIVSHKDANFANGRLVRRIYERVRLNHMILADASDRTFVSEDLIETFADDDMSNLRRGRTSNSIGFM